jgi:hypothetical protein
MAFVVKGKAAATEQSWMQSPKEKMKRKGRSQNRHKEQKGRQGGVHCRKFVARQMTYRGEQTIMRTPEAT